MRPVYDDDELLDTPPGYVPVQSKDDLVASAAKFAAEVLEDPQYLEKLKARAFAGALPPAIETMLWAYRFGKPIDASKIKQGPSESQMLADMSLEDLTALARKNAEEASLLLEAKMHKMGIAPIRSRMNEIQ